MALSPLMADPLTGFEKRHSLSLLASKELKLIVTQDKVRKVAVDAET